MHPAIARTNFRIQEWLLGRRTFPILRELEQTQHWPKAKLQELQFKRLQQITKHAYEKSEFWHSTMKRLGLTPKDIRSLEDLRKFPLLDKETVRNQRERFVDREGRRRVSLVRTSGSTNEALLFYTDSEREAHINAARIRGHRWIGINKGDREMYFWGSPIELSKQDRLKRLRDGLVNDGLTNGFEINSQLAVKYFEAWMRWRPKCIFGYPNSLMLMTMMARSQNLELQALRERGLTAICTTAEMLTEIDRQRISDGFEVPVFDSYGLREAGLIGHECRNQVMHSMDDQLLLETIDTQTLEATDGEGELVVTNLFSGVMPMIRYRTGDMVTMTSEPCSCGLSLNGIKVSGGRIADFVVTCDGRWIPGYAFIYICRSIPGVIKFQVQQDRPGAIHMVVATGKEFPSDGIERVAGLLQKRLQSDDQITVEIVDDIQPGKSGKYRPVVSRVAEAELNRIQRQ